MLAERMAEQERRGETPAVPAVASVLASVLTTVVAAPPVAARDASPAPADERRPASAEPAAVFHPPRVG